MAGSGVLGPTRVGQASPRSRVHESLEGGGNARTSPAVVASSGVLREAGLGILGPALSGLANEAPPHGWSSFVAGSDGLQSNHLYDRGGLFNDRELVRQLALVSATGASSSMGPDRPMGIGGSELRTRDTPAMAYVDRASMPGFNEPDEYDEHVSWHGLHRSPQWPGPQLQAASDQTQVANTEPSTRSTVARTAVDEAWEADLLEWKRRYGCPENVDSQRVRSPPEASKTEEIHRDAQAPAYYGANTPQHTTEAKLVADITMPSPKAQVQSPAALEASSPRGDKADLEVDAPHSFSKAKSVADTTMPSPKMEVKTPAALEASSPSGDKTDLEVDAPHSFSRLLNAFSHKDGPPNPAPSLKSPSFTARPLAVSGSVLPSSMTSDVLRTPRSRPHSSGRASGLASRPASAGRRYVYSKEDMELATTDATRRLGPGGSGQSGFSEAAVQKRDFFLDLRKQRDREKGRQATGPLWIHLATQAKNLASSLDLNDLLEAIKLFCSVRYEDYELYMRLLGEVPHFVKNANADQLCELIRLLARRRLRERNYVDMATAHLLQKIRITDDTLPARLMVKTANALASLECRSQQKFVEHFLRHMEHRIEELDADLCSEVSPVFIANYMSDALRRAYLKRCAEVQAGFHSTTFELRNLACTELVLRKEHHSFLVSLPDYVGRYLDKVRQHAAFDKWGSVVLPPAVAPDGPKGGHRSEMSASLQKKASTASGGQRGDVFNSDMHRDVSACLTHLGIEHENGVLCGPYLLDIVALDMENPAKRIVYEINSPHHYYEGTRALIAEKRLRHRMLSRLGQKLHHVTADDWRALTAAQKMTFILKLQHAQQDLNSAEAKRQSVANTARTPLPALKLDGVKQQETGGLRLKSVRDMRTPIRVPVPPSQRQSHRAHERC
mmetsp:Transcript_46683/g.92902  ORF Transcript_46683/g.92902 Transcript_46683/m.92902 type:complete len:900 (+) Transcript_46683:69-2768(+)